LRDASGLGHKNFHCEASNRHRAHDILLPKGPNPANALGLGNKRHVTAVQELSWQGNIMKFTRRGLPYWGYELAT